MKKYIIYIKAILFIGVVAFLFGFASNRNELKKVSDIDVNFTNGDNLFITYETVNKLLIQNYGELRSQRKENIILRSLEETLKSNDMIEDADVFLTIDGKLGASIKQRTPIARVNDEAVAYYIDVKGDRMPLSSNYSARVPLLSGVKENDIEDAYKLALLIYNDSFLQKQIIGIEQSSKKEFVLRTRIGNQQIEIGSLDNVKSKFKKLKAFYNKVLKDKTLNKYQIINLIYANQVVCTKK
jgi:cell division protein FtsQ